ncbi:ACT domain-containing protein [Anaeromicrobium sediminis]|uniref:UPF0735 ACT domain-containing protein CCE28_18730 n=1 Tax=Anaeromicrobium sediminis TaxID=1478221 RepID=A0A267MDA9_9FIRM|nr:ACT domain-containing protein [Anaeromicrobium sediminis]PAB57539.1 hypothetical protein CCE28_18730 [Anaeromicrobium sediminis]
MDKKFFIVHKKILPEVFEKVLEAKELLRTGKAKGITEATQKTGISRSTFYKYKEYVSLPSQLEGGQKATVTLLLDHLPGVLSKLLNEIADMEINVLTINQDIPINGIANVSMTFDRSRCQLPMDEIIGHLKSIEGTNKVSLVAME